MSAVIGAAIGIVSFLLGQFVQYLMQSAVKRKEMKLRIEEKMMDRAFNSMAEGWHLLNQTANCLEVYQAAVEAGGIERAQEKRHDDVMESVRRIEDWFARCEFFLPKQVRSCCREMHQELILNFAGAVPHDIPESVRRTLVDSLNTVRGLMEDIQKEYHPFYDREIGVRERSK